MQNGMSLQGKNYHGVLLDTRSLIVPSSVERFETTGLNLLESFIVNLFSDITCKL